MTYCVDRITFKKILRYVASVYCHVIPRPTILILAIIVQPQRRSMSSEALSWAGCSFYTQLAKSCLDSFERTVKTIVFSERKSGDISGICSASSEKSTACKSRVLLMCVLKIGCSYPNSQIGIGNIVQICLQCLGLATKQGTTWASFH